MEQDMTVAIDPSEVARQIIAEGYTIETMAYAMAQMAERLRASAGNDDAQGEQLRLPRGRKVRKPSSEAAAKERMRFAVRYFYDLQRLRIQAGGRAPIAERANEMILDAEDSEWMEQTSGNLQALEKQALREIAGLLEYFPVSEWLLSHKGLGPTLAGVIIAEFNIQRHETVSQMWSFAGLGVRNGRAPKPVKGEKLRYNAWLRSKLIGVMAGNFLKCGCAYREFYDNYKHRRESMRLPCVACGVDAKKRAKCENCSGTGVGPWGMSKLHRHNASLRYMTKRFLCDLHREWRTLEGLPVRPPYEAEYLDNQRHLFG